MPQRIDFLHVRTSISQIPQYGIEIDFGIPNRFNPVGLNFQRCRETQRQYYPIELRVGNINVVLIHRAIMR